jgi:hypothetical protein
MAPGSSLGLAEVEFAVSTAFFSLGDSPVDVTHSHFSVKKGGIHRAVVRTVFRESGIGVLPWLRRRRK